MKNFLRVAGVLFVTVGLFLSPADALYRFDDLYKPSGVGEQWMVITGGQDTVGNRAGGDVGENGSDSKALVASGDIVSDRNAIEVMNGTPTLSSGANRDIYAMFFVHQGQTGTLTVDHHFPGAADVDNGAVTPDVLDGTDGYSVRKTPKGTVDKTAKRYELLFVKTTDANKSTGNYGSVKGQFIFHQNPHSVSSQTAIVPFVVASVCDGTARTEPLLVRATLRDDNANARQRDIVAYDYFTWDVTSSKTAGGAQWVLVPVDTMYTTDEKIKYNLTTEVTNHTAIRYAAQRYDGYSTWPAQYPKYWKFDLPRLNEYNDLTYARTFLLDDESHIAPGLTAVYGQSYNVNEGDKRALRLYPVDPGAPYRELTLNHRVLFGLDLGSAEGTSSNTNTPVPYRVRAFKLRSASTDFLENVARKMNESNSELKEVLVPETVNFFTQSDIADDYISGSSIAAFAVKRSIPGNLRKTGTEGMLPLHITFNLRKEEVSLVSSHWDELMTQWHDYGDIHELFARYFSVFLLSRRDGSEDNPWNLLEYLKDSLGDDVYRDQVKIFMDEDRGVITVSFIAMMMDGTRDGTRPALYLVNDSVGTVENKFMVVRDGWNDNKWNLTFYVAPSGYTENNNTSTDSSGSSTSSNQSSSGGGGGCSAQNSGVLLTALALALVLGLKRGWR